MKVTVDTPDTTVVTLELSRKELLAFKHFIGSVSNIEFWERGRVEEADQTEFTMDLYTALSEAVGGRLIG